MSDISFAHVPTEGFLSFSALLNTEPWASIDIAPWEGPGQSASQSIGNAPTWVTIKLRLSWTITALSDALSGSATAKDCDVLWDNGQKRLDALLTAAAVHTDPQKREAAQRLQKLLLTGAGQGQTKLKYHQEVDFGHHQAGVVAQGQGAADVALLDLGSVMDEIAQATHTLAAAIGHGKGSGRPFERQKAALSDCASVFSDTVDWLAFLSERGFAADDRERAIALRQSLEAVAKRYEKSAKSAEPDQHGGEPAAPGNEKPA